MVAIGPPDSGSEAAIRRRVGVILEDSDAPESTQKLLEVRQAIGGPLLEHGHDEVVELGGDRLVMSRQRERAIVQMLLQQFGGRVRPKRRLRIWYDSGRGRCPKRSGGDLEELQYEAKQEVSL